MNLKRDWNEFWFSSVQTGPVALTRIAFGLLIIFAALQLWPDRFAWFSEHGILPTVESEAYTQMYTPGPRFINFLNGATDGQITLFFVVYILAAILMTIGLWTRPAIVLVWLGLNAIHNRNMIVNTTGGDQIMLIFTIYLLFSKCDASLSVSRLLRLRAAGRPTPGWLRNLASTPAGDAVLTTLGLISREGRTPSTMWIWPQRLMQIQVSIVYLSTFLNKSGGGKWQHGTAAYYPYMIKEFHRFTVPLLDAHHQWFIELATYGTLAVEFMLGTLVWVPRLRLYVLALGVLLHLGIEYSMNIPLFAFLMIASYISFLTQADLVHFQKWVKKRFNIDIPNAADLVRSKAPIIEPAREASGRSRDSRTERRPLTCRSSSPRIGG